MIKINLEVNRRENIGCSICSTHLKFCVSTNVPIIEEDLGNCLLISSLCLTKCEHTKYIYIYKQAKHFEMKVKQVIY